MGAGATGRICLGILACVLAAPATAGVITSTWVGGTGGWETPGNWSHVGAGSPDYPDNDTLSYDVIIGSGNPQLESNDVGIDTLALTGGSVGKTGAGGEVITAGSSHLSGGALDAVVLVTNGGVWSGGDLLNGAVLDNHGALQIDAPLIRLDGGGGAPPVPVSMFRNFGDVSWGATGAATVIELGNQGEIRNETPTATITVDGNATVRNVSGGVLDYGFSNAGLLRKTGAGVLEVNSRFDTFNSAQLDIQQGEVRFTRPAGTLSAALTQKGLFTTAPGTRFVVDGDSLEFADHANFINGGTIELNDGALQFWRGFGSTNDPLVGLGLGNDRLIVRGGRLHVGDSNPGNAPVIRVSHLELHGGRITGGPGIEAGDMLWTNGSIGGVGEMVLGNLTIQSGPASNNLGLRDSKTLRNIGTLDWTAADGTTFGMGGGPTALINEGDFVLSVTNADPGGPIGVEIGQLGASVVNRGPMLWQDAGPLPGELGMSADFRNEAGATLEMRGIETLFRQNVLNDATMLLSSGASVSVTNHGATFENNGTVEFGPFAGQGPELDVFGTLTGQGSFVGGGAVRILGGGVLDPVHGTGPMMMDTDLSFGGSSQVSIEVTGLSRGTGYDAIDVSGDLQLGGTLDLMLDLVLDYGQSLEIFDVGGALTGTFAGLGEGARLGSFIYLDPSDPLDFFTNDCLDMFGITDASAIQGLFPGSSPFMIDLFVTYAGGDGNDVVLYTAGNPSNVSEPGGIVLLLGGLIGLAFRRRRGAWRPGRFAG